MLRKIIIATFATALLAGTAGAASAATVTPGPWDQRHPRRVEVNHRLARQDMRINHDLRSGKITLHQARMLHRDDRMVRASERTDARFDKSHLTPADQRSLNQDENAVNRDIHHDAH
jgi:hypothetical protein